MHDSHIWNDQYELCILHLIIKSCSRDYVGNEGNNNNNNNNNTV